MGRGAVFLDLHGTLGAVHGEVQGDFPEFTWYPFASEAVRLLNQAGMLAIAVTNQNRIAAGRFTMDDFQVRMRELEQQLGLQGALLDAVCCCPHAPEDNCSCRKPLPGLIDEARKVFEIELAASYVVGDTGSTDILLAKAIGARGVLVRTGWGEPSLGDYRHTWTNAEAVYDIGARIFGARA